MRLSCHWTRIEGLQGRIGVTPNGTGDRSFDRYRIKGTVWMNGVQP